MLPYSLFTAEADPDLNHIYIDEVFSDMDRNKDGFISVEEYIGVLV